MLRHGPVVDASVGVARRQHLHVAVGVPHEGLAVVDVVLVEGLLGHHHRVLVQVHVVEEDGAAAERVRPDSRSLLLSEAGVDGALEAPVSVGLPLEEEWRVVVAAADVGVLADEATAQNRVARVHHALHRRLSLIGDLLGCEVGEVHLTVVRSEGERRAAGRERYSVVPNISLQLEDDLASFGSHSGEWPRAISINSLIVGRSDANSAVCRARRNGATAAWIEAHGGH